jgi:hypothetical protein
MPSSSFLTEVSVLLKLLINGCGRVSNINNINDDKGTQIQAVYVTTIFGL